MPNIEEHLRKAMADGKFNNLPGKGKPLQMDEANPHADPEWELAYRMLKDSGFTLPWIETRREIEADIEAARKELRLAWDWHQAALSEDQPARYVTAEWKRALAAFKEKLGRLNQRIRDYNLQVPQPRFQRTVLDVDSEVGKITTATNK